MPQGTAGVSMFYLPVRNDDGSLNSMEVQRLKDKLGTRAVPTAELLLDGTQALLVNSLRCCDLDSQSPRACGIMFWSSVSVPKITTVSVRTWCIK